MKVTLNTRSLEDYRKFLVIKQLPAWSIRGSVATFPDEYADRLGVTAPVAIGDYTPEPFLFDYQKDICRTATQRRKFAVFADCGLGKSLILLSYARYVRERVGRKRILILTPPLVVTQLIEEAAKFWGDDLPVEKVKASNLAEWLSGEGDAIGISNYEALKEDTPQGNLAALILDESSVLKNHYGNYAGICLRLGEGLKWKLALTGTPAPNDRIEYANHACFLDRFPTVNAFLATYFINRGQTGERWELKPHALRSFYRSLSDWSIFLTDPSVYGWKDNCNTIPPIHTHIHDVPLTQDQRDWVNQELGTLMATRTGGITMRASYGQVSKGEYKGRKFATLKYDVIKSLIDSWKDDESTLIWCLYNEEQKRVMESLPEAKCIDGSTPMAARYHILDWFRRRICNCELERRLAKCKKTKRGNTCDSTIEPTNTDGKSAAPKPKRNTTRNVESDTPTTPHCESTADAKRSNGKLRIKTSDLPSVLKSTASRLGTTTPCSTTKMANAPSAEAKKTASDSTSITATQPGPSAGCSADRATLPSASCETERTSVTPQEITCSCTPHQLSCGRVLVSKPVVLGYGLNLQVATRQVFSGLQDSYEQFYQAVKRSNRIGSTKPLNVHIPVTELELPMIENVLRKANRVEADAREQEQLFREALLGK